MRKVLKKKKTVWWTSGGTHNVRWDTNSKYKYGRDAKQKNVSALNSTDENKCKDQNVEFGAVPQIKM